MIGHFGAVKYLKAAVLNWGVAVIIFFVWMLTGCMHANKEFHQVVTFENVKVHIVSDQSQIDSAIVDSKKTVNGNAVENSEIWLVGYKDSSGIRVKRIALGHELLNLMHSKDKKISSSRSSFN